MGSPWWAQSGVERRLAMDVRTPPRRECQDLPQRRSLASTPYEGAVLLAFAGCQIRGAVGMIESKDMGKVIGRYPLVYVRDMISNITLYFWSRFHS